MSRRMTVVFHDEELYTDLKVEAVRRHKPASDIVADAVVDFNQGLDARLIDEGVAQELKGLRINPIRMAYDVPSEREALKRAIPALERAGFRRRRMLIYVLYNFRDSPEEFLDRIRDLLDWGVVAYPMRFDPRDSLKKNQHIGAKWTAEQLEMVAKARRVLGYGGAFPPYEGLRRKFLNANCFEEAFALRPPGDRGGNGHESVEELLTTGPLTSREVATF